MFLEYRKILNLIRPVDAAIWACVLITFLGFFRPKSQHDRCGWRPDAQGKCIQAQDIVLDQEYGLAISVVFKTRQYGPAPTMYVAGSRGHPLDTAPACQ